MTRSIIPPIHPGEILREEYLVPLKMSPVALAKRLNVPQTRMERLVAKQTAMTPDTALRFSKFFGTSAEVWMNLQSAYDLKIEEKALKADLSKIENLDAA